MIFGFNTDIRHEDTVYHVQSEARTGEQLLQTQVFVKGRCIGKRAVSYDASGPIGNAGIPNVVPNVVPNAVSNAVSNVVSNDVPKNDQDREKMLRELHREVLDAIRDGKLDSILDKRESTAVKELDLEWVNAGSVHSSGALTMLIRVTEGGVTVEGARLTLRFARPDAVPFYTQVVTDAKGNAEMKVHVNDATLAESSVLVQASFAGKTATRKFQLRVAV